MLLKSFDGLSAGQIWALIIVSGVGGGVITLVPRWSSIRDWRVGRSASDWPIVEGDVYGTTLTGQGDFAVTVSYGYHRGAYQGGDFTVPFSSLSESEKFEERMKNHAKIIVRYDPADPSRSAILLSDNEPSLEDG
jgi:hypothetical protein